MEFSTKPKKYYIAAAIISIISLLLFLNDGVFSNVKNLVVSSFIGLLPFIIDDLVFLDDSRSYKESKEFKILRGITIVGIVLIGVICFIWFFVSINVLQTPDDKTLTYLVVNPTGGLNSLNFDLLHKILSIDCILAYHVVVFIVSIAIRFANSHFYRLKLERIKKGK